MVSMFMLAPVKLPSRVCTQLIVASIGRVAETERTACHSIAQSQRLSLHQITVLVKQFCIQHTTDVRRTHFTFPQHISSIPDSITQEITGVVHVHRDYLLGCLLCIGGHLTDKKSQRVIVHLALHNRKTRICDKHTDLFCFTLTPFLPHNLFLCLTSLNDFIRPQIRVVFGVADSFQHVSPCLLLWEIPIKTIQIEHHGLATCPHTFKFCYHITNPCIMRV